ncbi:MAG: SH3 domain-containing protein [Christensenellaceae bacterium]|nr:SH3 domain-containing protein [Christensenellaceae bacterium]
MLEASNKIAKNKNYKTISRLIQKTISLILIAYIILSLMPIGTSIASGTVYSFGTINIGGVNIRHSVNGNSFQQLPKGTVVQILETLIDSSNRSWLGVYIGGSNVSGYVMAEYVNIMSPIDSAAYASNNPSAIRPGNGPLNSINAIGYVRTIVGGINLRDSINGFVVGKVDRNIIFPYVSVETKSDYTWYRIYSDTLGYCYIRGDCVSLSDAAGNITNTSTTPQQPVINPQPAPPSPFGSIVLTLDKVNLRNDNKTNAFRLGHLAIGTVLPLLSTPSQSEGYTWYHVDTHIGRGYVRGDCARLTSDPAPVITVQPPAPSTFGSIIITLDNVNLRQKPAGTRVGKVLIGQTFNLLSQPVYASNYTWYHIKNNDGIEGYVRGDCAKLNSTQPTITEAPTQPIVPLNFGYVLVKLSSVNLRQEPAGKVLDRVDAGELYALTGNTVSKSGYTWYPINVRGNNGYLRSDCVQYLTQEQGQAYLAGGNIDSTTLPGQLPVDTLPPVVGTSEYVITIVDKVNLRKSASKTASAPFNVPLGTVLKYSRTTFVGSSEWYKISYNGYDLWVLGSTVRKMSINEYQEWNATQPIPTPQPVAGYVKTTVRNVNVRIKPAGDVIDSIATRGTVLPYYGTQSVGRYTWYNIKLASGALAYIRGDCVKVSTETGDDITQTPVAPPSGGGQLEASYTTLMVGSSGDDVKRLQTELKKLGFYTGDINGNYTDEVKQAVMSFQASKGLVPDGIAGPNTLHKLYNTVPIGSSTGEDLSFEMIYPVKSIDWWTGGIQQLWPKGANAKLKDVKTGIVFWVHRWSGGNHVDGEPLTAADTARVCQMYGVKNAKEIATKNLWQRRPLWVTLGGSTYAASLYGVPHNYAGDSIPDNNFYGQFCIHFTNSKTHTSNIVDKYHEQAIQYAITTGNNQIQ